MWTFEHVIVPDRLRIEVPVRPKSGKMGIAPEGWFVDPLDFPLAHVAARHEEASARYGREHLSLRPTRCLFAKQAASIDVLSGGRLTLGLGIGWLERGVRRRWALHSNAEAHVSTTTSPQ